jgi:hypothetical protein
MSERVRRFVEEFTHRARGKRNEPELTEAFTGAARDCLVITDLRLEEMHQGGRRLDVRRNRVIIEFERHQRFQGRKESQGYQEARRQLVEDYIPLLAEEEDLSPSAYTGVCFDGEHIGFVFIEENGNVRETELEPFNERSAAVLVAHLESDIRVDPHLTGVVTRDAVTS